MGKGTAREKREISGSNCYCIAVGGGYGCSKSMRRFACLSRACLGFVMLLTAAFAAETTPPPPPPAGAAQPAVPEVALMIVYDTSGSMTEKIRTKSGTEEAKHVIGKRALAAKIKPHL